MVQPTGVQLAAEIHRSGRPVTLSTGEHIRVPRTYRNRDIKWWMDSLGLMDLLYTEMEDLTRARKLPSLQLVGSDDRIMLDLNCLQQMGIELAGRLAGFNNGKVQFFRIPCKHVRARGFENGTSTGFN